MGYYQAREYQARTPEKEQQFTIQQAKASDSYSYLKEEFNREMNNLKISKPFTPAVRPVIPILPVLAALQTLPPVQPSRMGAAIIMETDNIYSVIDEEAFNAISENKQNELVEALSTDQEIEKERRSLRQQNLSPKDPTLLPKDAGN